MQQDIRMLTLIRKDLNLKREKLLNLVSRSSHYFLFENNESNLCNELHVQLSHEEILWLNGGQKRSFGWKEDEESLRDVSFKCEMNDIPQFGIFDDSSKGINGEGSSLVGLTLGPFEWNEILKISGKFKSI